VLDKIGGVADNSRFGGLDERGMSRRMIREKTETEPKILRAFQDDTEDTEEAQITSVSD
jgi:hypothetical protein